MSGIAKSLSSISDNQSKIGEKLSGIGESLSSISDKQSKIAEKLSCIGESLSSISDNRSSISGPPPAGRRIVEPGRLMDDPQLLPTTRGRHTSTKNAS